MSDELHAMGQGQFTFVLADANEVRGEREVVQTVDVVTDMTRRCSKCRKRVVAESLSLSLVDVVDSKALHDAQWAVATAMFNVKQAMLLGTQFSDLPYDRQAWWMKQAAEEGWVLSSFDLEKVGFDMNPNVRAAGIAEARKWAAYTDRRKVFRVSGAVFPPGWLHLSFEARSSKTGQPLKNANVIVHVCPECAAGVFAAAGFEPTDPFGNGAKW